MSKKLKLNLGPKQVETIFEALRMLLSDHSQDGDTPERRKIERVVNSVDKALMREMKRQEFEL